MQSQEQQTGGVTGRQVGGALEFVAGGHLDGQKPNSGSPAFCLSWMWNSESTRGRGLKASTESSESPLGEFD